MGHEHEHLDTFRVLGNPTDMSLTLTPLMTLIDAYIAVTGMSDGALSNRVFKDGKKISALRNGKDITSSRMDAAIQWFANNWPDSSVWPRGVPRPHYRFGQSEPPQPVQRTV